MIIEISSPRHGQIESLELPNSYSNFKGQVLCGSIEVVPGPKEWYPHPIATFVLEPNNLKEVQRSKKYC